MKHITLQFAIMFLVVLSFVACRNNDNPIEEKPTNFLDLKVDQSFKFESFSNVETSIKIGNTKALGSDIIQIYDANPNLGGKVILTGSVNQNGEFNLPLRIASRLKEVYVGKLSSTGINEFIAVLVQGNVLSFNFATQKSEETINPCNDGCTQTVQGTNTDLIITSGQMVCVNEGTSAVFNKLKIETGGVLRICGTASVNSYKSGGGGAGTIIVSPDGHLNLPKYNIVYTVENYGTLNFNGSSDGTVQSNGSIHNWGDISSCNKFINEGSIINDGSFTLSNTFTNNPNGTFVNNCEMVVDDDSNNAFKQNGNFTNNGYVYVDGRADFTGSGGKITTFGVGSLFGTDSFKVQGAIVGPNTQGAQLTAKEDSQTSSGSSITGYVDLWVKNGHHISPNGGTKGPNVTYHAYTVNAPSCDANSAPIITSSLQIGGLLNQAIPPYVITATGTETITYNATGLPAGFTYNSSTHTISGTSTSVGTFEVTLTATNFMGTDTKTLVIIIAEPPAPPVITSVLTAQTTVNQDFNYTLTATGLGPITYNVTDLPDGLTFNPTTQLISGSPTSAGTSNINLFATNSAGTRMKYLF
jgi:hypothetical protein